MELSWVNKVRIGAVAALGIVVIGMLAWPMAAPEDPMAPVRAGHLGFGGTLGLLVMAFGIGFASFFIAWPHGREIGILAVPFGLSIWAIRSGSMQVLTQGSVAPEQRQALLSSLRFEPLYWLLIVAAGFIGVIVAQCVATKSKSPAEMGKLKECLKPDAAVMGLVAVLAAALVAQFFVGVFAQNLTTGTNIAAQPVTGQIVFAGIGAFAAAGFVVKKFFGLSYVWTALASVLVVPFAIITHYRGDTVQEFAQTQPATFYPHAVFGLLPLHLVAFGAIGSVVGYWLAIRYDHWRQHEAGV